MSTQHIETAFSDSWPENVEIGDLVPRRSTLDGFASQPGCACGVAVQSLSAGDLVTVHTRHSRYRMVVLDGPDRRVSITGGALFPDSTEVRVAGATAGGSAVKIGWIGEGLRLELATAFGPVITSRVELVTIGDEATDLD